jgi:HEAT repeat protein
MAAGTHLKKIETLLAAGTTEEAMAAAVVLGALAPRDASVVKALTRALNQTENLPLALAAARALGRIGNAAALVALLPLLHASGELRESGALAIAGCGRAALPALKKEMARADFHTRTVLLGILARMRGTEPLRIVLETFFEDNFELVKAAGRALRSQVPSLSPAERAAAVKTALAFLKTKAVRDSRSAQNSTLIYLGMLAHPDAVPVLLGYTVPAETRATRRHALGAVKNTFIEGPVPAKVVDTLFPYLDDPDYEAVVDPALTILNRADIPARYEKELRRLVGGRYPAVRQFAVRKLAGLDTKASAITLMDVLAGKDETLRRSAVHALKRSAQAPALLFPRLLEETEPERTWSLVHLIKPNAASLTAADLKKLERTSLAFLDKKDRRAEAFLHLFRHADEAAFTKAFYKRALAAKQKRRYADAERDLRLISRSPQFDDDARFLLGLMMLKAAGKDLLPATESGRRVQEAFRRMAERKDFRLESRLRKDARTLGPEGFFAVGCGLVESTGPAKELGIKLLRAQVKKGPRTRIGKLARARLESEGLA